MVKQLQRQKHLIDAEGQILGRLATRVSLLLRGKHKVEWEPHKDIGDFVQVENVDKISVTGKKMDDKIYYHYSGYPGGLKETKMKELMAKRPEEVLRRAVWNMLPKNKLRSRFIKRLTFVK